MNPVLLLLGMLSAGAISLGKSGKDSTNNGNRRSDQEDTRQTSRDETDTTVPEETVTEPPAEETTPQEPQPEPEPDPVVQDPTPDAPVQSGDGGSGAETTPTPINSGTIEVMAGRVATLDPEGDVANIRIVSGVEHGTITVNPDNTFALVMTQSDFVGTQSFTYEATHADGSVTYHEVGLDVTPGLQEAGWGTGESHYMLATDENDRIVVEHGENHTKVYVSGSSSALSIADIAAMAGVSTSTVTGSWLADHPEYGRTEGTALAEDAAELLWMELTPRGSESSNWLLLERGYEYSELMVEDQNNGVQRLIGRDVHGESELNPIYIGAWGDGDRPILSARLMTYQEASTNVVIQDIHFADGFTILGSENFIFDNVKTTDGGNVIQDGSGITIRNSEVYDSHKDSPRDGSTWGPGDRAQGLYADANDGLLIEGSLFDHNGWEDGYDPDGSGSAPMPPNMYNHNIYLDATNIDVTFRDTITMRASSYGIQVRSGGFVEDNLILDNNAGISFYGGDYYGAGFVGQYTLASDNVITSAAHKVSEYGGALTWGIFDQAQMSSMVDNIIAHLEDPNNPEPWKTITQEPVQTDNPYYNDTIIYNWAVDFEPWRGEDENTDGLDTNVLDQTTIQLFTAQLLGKSDATISDLADYLRAQADGQFDDIVDADLIIRFFQEGFGIAPDVRLEADTLSFVPNDLGEGVRWDNRLNWDTDDLPGLYAGDSVDLRGNDVVFGTNTTIDTLGFGEGGSLNVYGGKLTATGGLTGDGGHLNVEGAGQAWVGGSDGADIDITVQGGRFANTGDMSNADLTVTGGQTILATGGAEFDLGASKTLAVFDAAAKVGFDGDDGGLAILDMHEGATLAFEADNGDLGTIEEFRSGAYGDAPDVQSGIDLGDATLSINLAGLTATDGEAFMLMDADEIVGLFSDASVEGLNGQDARIVIDYENDSVTLELSAGNGAVSIDTVGVEADVTSGEEALWDALTAGQGVASDTELAMLPEEEDPLLDVAA